MATVSLNRPIPVCAGGFPVAGGTPFRDGVGPTVATFPEKARQLVDLAVYLEREQIHIRAALGNQFNFLWLGTGQHSGGRVIGVQLMDHLRQVINCVPDFRIGVAKVQLIAYAPHQQGGVVFQGQDILFDLGQLTGNRLFIIVIEAVALTGHFNSHADH